MRQAVGSSHSCCAPWHDYHCDQ